MVCRTSAVTLSIVLSEKSAVGWSMAASCGVGEGDEHPMAARVTKAIETYLSRTGWRCLREQGEVKRLAVLRASVSLYDARSREPC